MNRQEFIKGLGGVLGTAALGGCCSCAYSCKKAKFNLAMAGWTLNHLKVDDALAFCEKHGFRYLCVKDFHLPYDSRPAQVAEFLRKCADHGVTPYGAGPIESSTPDEAKRGFEFAALLGLKRMTGVPSELDKARNKQVSSPRMLELCSRLADEYGINFAIHNHGRNPKTGNPDLYPAVPETYELIKDLSPRMGFCVDWAFTYADGLDCAAVARRYGARIFDGHVRCVTIRDGAGYGINPAKRVFDYAPIFDALCDIGYDGFLGLELSNDSPEILPWKTWESWIDESHDYFEGLIAARR